MSPGVGVGVAAGVVDVFCVAQLVTNKVAIMQGSQKTRAHFVNLAEHCANLGSRIFEKVDILQP